MPIPQDRVQVIRHHRKLQNINPEDSGKKLQPLPSPFMEMFVILSRKEIFSARTGSRN